MEDHDGKLSNCCGATIKLHDICSDCGEHTVSEEEEESPINILNKWLLAYKEARKLDDKELDD